MPTFFSFLSFSRRLRDEITRFVRHRRIPPEDQEEEHTSPTGCRDEEVVFTPGNHHSKELIGNRANRRDKSPTMDHPRSLDQVIRGFVETYRRHYQVLRLPALLWTAVGVGLHQHCWILPTHHVLHGLRVGSGFPSRMMGGGGYF